MKMKFRIVGGLLLTVVAATVFGSCVSDKDSSGLEYMPDMYRSPAIEPYVDYGELQGREDKSVKDKLSAMTPPAGAIPYYGTDKEEVAMMLPWSIRPNISFRQTHGLKGFEFTSEDTYNTLAAALTKNPYTITEENAEGIFKEGKRLYTNACAHCHGENGDGNGPMMANKVYVGVPDYKNKKELSDGQIFYSIYYGKGSMGSHASLLNKKEIWTLVHYVRKFQDKEYGKVFNQEPEEEEGAEGENDQVADNDNQEPTH